MTTRIEPRIPEPSDASKPLGVTLRHVRNPDIRGGYWDTPVDSGRAQKVPVASMEEASAVVRAYIERNHLGGGNFPTATVTDARGRKVGEVSYNGRTWTLAQIAEREARYAALRVQA